MPRCTLAAAQQQGHATTQGVLLGDLEAHGSSGSVPLPPQISFTPPPVRAVFLGTVKNCWYLGKDKF